MDGIGPDRKELEIQKQFEGGSQEGLVNCGGMWIRGGKLLSVLDQAQRKCESENPVLAPRDSSDRREGGLVKDQATYSQHLEQKETGTMDKGTDY